MSDVPKPEQDSAIARAIEEAEPVSPAGAELTLDTPEQRRAAIDQAFDYRGDVHLVLADGRSVQGYIYDRRADADPPYFRMMLRDGGQEKMSYDQLAGLKLDDRDPAAGKSWETWVKKYIEKKMNGEEASIHAEPLDQ